MAWGRQRPVPVASKPWACPSAHRSFPGPRRQPQSSGLWLRGTRVPGRAAGTPRALCGAGTAAPHLHAAAPRGPSTLSATQIPLWRQPHNAAFPGAATAPGNRRSGAGAAPVTGQDARRTHASVSPFITPVQTPSLPPCKHGAVRSLTEKAPSGGWIVKVAPGSSLSATPQCSAVILGRWRGERWSASPHLWGPVASWSQLHFREGHRELEALPVVPAHALGEESLRQSQRQTSHPLSPPAWFPEVNHPSSPHPLYDPQRQRLRLNLGWSFTSNKSGSSPPSDNLVRLALLSHFTDEGPGAPRGSVTCPVTPHRLGPNPLLAWAASQAPHLVVHCAPIEPVEVGIVAVPIPPGPTVRDGTGDEQVVGVSITGRKNTAAVVAHGVPCAGVEGAVRVSPPPPHLPPSIAPRPTPHLLCHDSPPDEGGSSRQQSPLGKSRTVQTQPRPRHAGPHAWSSRRLSLGCAGPHCLRVGRVLSSGFWCPQDVPLFSGPQAL